MSTIWTPHDPVTTPPRWIAFAAGIGLVAVAAVALILGFSTGWSRGTPRQGTVATAEDSKVLEASPLDPAVTLRGVNAAEPPKTEAANTATNAAAEEEDEPEPVEEEAPQLPPVVAPPPKAATPDAPADTPAQNAAPAPAPTAPADVPF